MREKGNLTVLWPTCQRLLSVDPEATRQKQHYWHRYRSHLVCRRLRSRCAPPLPASKQPNRNKDSPSNPRPNPSPGDLAWPPARDLSTLSSAAAQVRAPLLSLGIVKIAVPPRNPADP
jgi:hypothetical protein